MTQNDISIGRSRVETINPLTSIRGVAALWVAYFHYVGPDTSPADPSGLTFVKCGFLGVDIFFILSGFIMSYCYAHFFTASGVRRNMYFRFLGLRLARIYPLHLFLLILYLLLTFEVFLPHHTFAKNYEFQWMYWTTFVQSLLLVQSWYVHHYKFWNDAAWTISVEWFFYLLFPAIVALFMRLPKVATFALVIPLYVLIALSQSDDPSFWGVQHIKMHCGGLLRGGVGYLTGILLYRLYSEKALFSLPWKTIGNTCLVLTPVAVVAVHRIAFILPLFAVLIYALAHPSNARHPVWSSRPLIFLGDISYSVYMIQFFILPAFVHPNAHWTTAVSAACCVGFTAVLIIFSFISYRFVERPSRQFIRKHWMRSETAELTIAETPVSHA